MTLNDKTKLMLWDLTLLVGVVLYLTLKLPMGDKLVLGIFTIQVLIHCIRKHTAWYKLTGKAY